MTSLYLWIVLSPSVLTGAAAGNGRSRERYRVTWLIATQLNHDLASRPELWTARAGDSLGSFAQFANGVNGFFLNQSHRPIVQGRQKWANLS
jgi:hypothetical protein